jgi:hypothetical protein
MWPPIVGTVLFFFANWRKEVRTSPACRREARAFGLNYLCIPALLEVKTFGDFVYCERRSLARL